jgi:hypothetical protein
MRFRLLALSLAIGGIAWGLFSALLLLAGAQPLEFVVIFGPGYAITAGYIARVCHTPKPVWRILLWLASTLVQGYWLGWILLGAVRGELRGSTFELLSIAWWVYAFLVSVYGILGDVHETREKRQNGP